MRAALTGSVNVNSVTRYGALIVFFVLVYQFGERVDNDLVALVLPVERDEQILPRHDALGDDELAERHAACFLLFDQLLELGQADFAVLEQDFAEFLRTCEKLPLIFVGNWRLLVFFDHVIARLIGNRSYISANCPKSKMLSV